MYKEGERITCPHCKSVQIKSMANQPKKYPKPKMYWFSNKKEIEALRRVWNNGYDCKKCGNEFLALQWEQNASPLTTKKKSGFFGKLFKWAFILLIAFIALAYFMSDDEPKKQSNPTKETVKEESILHDVFSEDAEKAAHENIPTEADYKKVEKSIESSQDQNDTLSIKTTVRDSE